MVSDRQDAICRMRAEHSRASWRREDAAREQVFFNAQLRDDCAHEEFAEVGDDWLQCRRCWWCKPKLGRPPKLERLPAILRDRVLPPLEGKVDLHKVYATAGIVFDGDDDVLRMVRVRVVQYSWTSDTWVAGTPIRRCGVEVRFKDHGWKEAAVFMETALHRLLSVLEGAEPRKPKKLWLAIQDAFDVRPNWPKPWRQAS